jgi:hypothetical protein
MVSQVLVEGSSSGCSLIERICPKLTPVYRYIFVTIHEALNINDYFILQIELGGWFSQTSRRGLSKAHNQASPMGQNDVYNVTHKRGEDEYFEDEVIFLPG